MKDSELLKNKSFPHLLLIHSPKDVEVKLREAIAKYDTDLREVSEKTVFYDIAQSITDIPGFILSDDELQGEEAYGMTFKQIRGEVFKMLKSFPRSFLVWKMKHQIYQSSVFCIACWCIVNDEKSAMRIYKAMKGRVIESESMDDAPINQDIFVTTVSFSEGVEGELDFADGDLEDIQMHVDEMADWAAELKHAKRDQ